MKYTKFTYLVFILMIGFSCTTKQRDQETYQDIKEQDKGFNYIADRFADLQILRYQVPDFDMLTLSQKKLVYYLSQAALSGRDIIYDQNYKHNLKIRRTIEGIYKTFPGDKTTGDFQAFEVYAKRVWVSNGIHHHYSNKKLEPDFSPDFFKELVNMSDEASLPLEEGETKADLIDKLTPLLFDMEIDAKKVNKDSGIDNIAASANNYYEGVTQAEVEAFYQAKKQGKGDHQPSWGLNSKLVKENGQLVEKVWKVGGMYSESIEKIVYWLEKATEVAENEQQKTALEKLIEYYKTGDLKIFDEYSIAWVEDTESTVDAINGFIEVYGDAIGYKGAYESVVSFKDFESSKRMAVLSENAQWFEDNSTIMDEHKRANVKGVSYKVITVAMEAGDAAPSTPIGINLPNSNWIRSEHGSKSVSLGNVISSYNNASSKGSLDEFFFDPEVKNRIKAQKGLAGKLHTALHEVIGHASGKINEGVGNPNETLKNYRSTLEEARADLVSLYYAVDEKLIEIGVMPSVEVGMAEYDTYITNGLMLQLRRLDLGENVEEDHMRNRQMISKWCLEKGKADNVIEKKVIDGKTYFAINDYDKLRELFGQLLREIQRIKSEGDYEAGKALVENYGVKVDPELHAEVLERYSTLNVAPYSAFIQPKLVPVMEGEEIADVKVEIPESFVDQMLDYGDNYSFLPNYN